MCGKFKSQTSHSLFKNRGRQNYVRHIRSPSAHMGRLAIVCGEMNLDFFLNSATLERVFFFLFSFCPALQQSSALHNKSCSAKIRHKFKSKNKILFFHAGATNAEIFGCASQQPWLSDKNLVAQLSGATRSDILPDFLQLCKGKDCHISCRLLACSFTSSTLLFCLSLCYGHVNSSILWVFHSIWSFSVLLRRLRKTTISFVTSVCPSAQNSAPNGPIFVNFDTWNFFFFENASRKFKFH
jgi:hypothetical protein